MNNFKKPFFMSSFRSDDFGDDFDDAWNSGPVPPSNWKRGGNARDLYDEAYGDYQGGYGPSGGYGRNRNSMPRGGPYGPSSGFFGPSPDDDFGPPRNFGPRGGTWMGPLGPIGDNFGPPHFGPRDSNFGPRDSNFGPRDSNFGPRDANFGPRNPNFGPRNFGPQDDDFDYDFDDGAYDESGEGFYALGRGYGPDGPPSKNNKGINNRVHRYLTRCGVPKEYLKNMPTKFCELIEPNHCGLCGHDFESFQLSRIHYISKNHLKKQKKWIQLFQNDSASLVPEEKVPLKSRDLYCELCDVHITSKAHSDSHYAGRPHRSIVEGRKPPKNPLLLQPNMEGRLQLLIRREKRNLKPVEEAEEPKPETDPSKPVPPELYCAICKTSVTCTEQMTMHLNGKRHLTKEKQHILKMMSGQGQNDESKDDMNEDAADDESKDDMNEDAADDESKDDNNEDAADDGEKPTKAATSTNDEAVNWGQGGGELWEAI